MRGGARRRSAGPSSANGITLTQWHSDYIIAGLSSGRPLSFAPSARAHYGHIRVRRPVSLLISRRGFFFFFLPSDSRSAPTRRLFSGDKWRGRQRVMSANEAAGERASSGILCVTLVVFRDASSYLRPEICPSSRENRRISPLSGIRDKRYNRGL